MDQTDAKMAASIALCFFGINDDASFFMVCVNMGLGGLVGDIVNYMADGTVLGH